MSEHSKKVVREPPRNKVHLLPAGNGIKKRQAIIKLTGNAELIITRQRADGRTVGIKGYIGSFKTLNVEDLIAAVAYVTHTDEELEEKYGSVPEHPRDEVQDGEPIPF